jgi:dCTP deaminase
MILNGDEIYEAIQNGSIGIEPFFPNKIGTNSYDVHLSQMLLEYEEAIIDPKRKNHTREIKIPEDGIVLNPGQFVLGSTKEFCSNNANCIVPMIEGKSSVARLGISVHITAGFGDVKFCGNWTLEIMVAQRVRVYYDMPIAQLYWLRTTPTERCYKGKYQNQRGVVASRSFVDFSGV